MRALSLMFGLLFISLAHAGKPLTLSGGQVISATESSFLEQCSGIKVVSDVNWSLAYANCMGRVRGLAEGHTIAIVAQKQQPWWCIPAKVTDGELYTSVLTWISKTPQDVAALTKNTRTPNEAATILILRGLMLTYPCKTI